MIVCNGYIRIKTVVGGLGSNGYPAPQTTNFGDQIACRIIPNSPQRQKLSEAGNTYKEADYKILVEMADFSAEVVELQRNGVVLGEFAVQGDPEYLPQMKTTIIYLKCQLSV